MQKRAVQFAKKPYLPLFSSETVDKFARDYAIEKSFRHALHLVTVHLHCQNQVAHALRTRDFWLASLSMHFPIHFTRRAHEYPVTLMSHCTGKSADVFCDHKLLCLPAVPPGQSPLTSAVTSPPPPSSITNDSGIPPAMVPPTSQPTTPPHHPLPGHTGM